MTGASRLLCAGIVLRHLWAMDLRSRSLNFSQAVNLQSYLKTDISSRMREHMDPTKEGALFFYGVSRCFEAELDQIFAEARDWRSRRGGRVMLLAKIR
jgi:hypothetical protein